MKVGSLFSGAGGLDRAVEAVFDADTIWHSEVDPAASKVLAARWPGVPNLGDITTIDWSTVERPDILCGGFPCQDVSTAGRRAGLADGTRSGLWSHMAEAINQLRPRWVVVENVKGLLSANATRALEPDDLDVGNGPSGSVLRAAGAVLGDLADLGYDAQWVTVAAADVGAPHRRERVFVLADADRDRRQRRRRSAVPGSGGHPLPSGAAPLELLSTPQARDWKGTNSNRGGPWQSLPRDLSDLLPTPQAADGNGGKTSHPDTRRAAGHSVNLSEVAIALLPTPAAADGQRGQDFARADRDGSGGDDLVTLAVKASRDNQWGKYTPAIAQWERLTRPAPSPTEPNRNGNPRLAAAFSEWLMGWPAGWVTDPAEGLTRNEQLRICGNGVVSHQAAYALRLLLDIAEVDE